MAMTYEDLREQLTWAPSLDGKLPGTYSHTVLGGMGGSALGAYAARFLDPTISLSAHRDYDLPEQITPDTLYIAVSYSGNTAETLSFARAACEHQLPLVVITSGGELAEFAHKKNIPFILVPTGLPPRNALFYFLRALFSLLNRADLSDALSTVTFNADDIKTRASLLGRELSDTLPIFYTSRKNGFLAYYAKISFNETGKTPAYANLFSEFNHNEMQSFDKDAPKRVMDTIRFVILRDTSDDARVTRRMDVFTELMTERGRTVIPVEIAGETRAAQLVRESLYLELAATTIAQSRGINPDTTPLIEDFKKRL